MFVPGRGTRDAGRAGDDDEAAAFQEHGKRGGDVRQVSSDDVFVVIGAYGKLGVHDDERRSDLSQPVGYGFRVAALDMGSRKKFCENSRSGEGQFVQVNGHTWRKEFWV